MSLEKQQVILGKQHARTSGNREIGRQTEVHHITTS